MQKSVAKIFGQWKSGCTKNKGTSDPSGIWTLGHTYPPITTWPENNRLFKRCKVVANATVNYTSSFGRRLTRLFLTLNIVLMSSRIIIMRRGKYFLSLSFEQKKLMSAQIFLPQGCQEFTNAKWHIYKMIHMYYPLNVTNEWNWLWIGRVAWLLQCNVRPMFIVQLCINVQLVSRLTGLDSTKQETMLLFAWTDCIKPVKLETFYAVILPLTVSEFSLTKYSDTFPDGECSLN